MAQPWYNRDDHDAHLSPEAVREAIAYAKCGAEFARKKRLTCRRCKTAFANKRGLMRHNRSSWCALRAAILAENAAKRAKKKREPVRHARHSRVDPYERVLGKAVKGSLMHTWLNRT